MRACARSSAAACARRTNSRWRAICKYRGYKFVDRFDANSYIYITRAMDTFDLTQRGSLPSLFENIATRFLVISFTSDWLYPSYQSLEIVSALRSRNCDVAYLQSGIALRTRLVSGGSGRADRDRPRIPGEHLPGGRRWAFVKSTGAAITPSSAS